MADESRLAHVSYSAVETLIGDPFRNTPENLIAQYDSKIHCPQLVFLGVDERADGLNYKDRYKGAPCFALDVTPNGDERVAELNTAATRDGNQFVTGRVMDLVATDGKFRVI